MRYYFLFVLACIIHGVFGQMTPFATKRGSFYFYWGWNRAYYAPSTLRFHGNTYDFQLYDVVAVDRQSPFSPSLYFSPKKMTIPQYNFRMGYYFKNGLQFSLGVDHMKYVMLHDQRLYLQFRHTLRRSIHQSGLSNITRFSQIRTYGWIELHQR